MALVQWQPEEIDILFPGVQWFARNIHYFDPTLWASSAFRYFWDSFRREAVRQIAYETTNIARHAGTQVGARANDALARLMESAQWVVANLRDAATAPYRMLENYYTELPSLNPAQRRALFARLEASPIDRPTGREKMPLSGEFIDKHGAPGGAQQRSCPDWLLPLILGFYNPPNWAVSDGTRKVYGKRKASNRPKANNKRRRRSSRN
ncbi:VP3 [Lepus polyomavirus 1]|nr:VP3 [Lepus polyomavirus 1]QIJ55567.1 VP3 [Lepus polyomavirus 1]QIJ55572.1 VP3 [Lepus polyomavirus 1]